MAAAQGGMSINKSTPRVCVQHQGWGAHLNTAVVMYLILQHTIKTNLFYITFEKNNFKTSNFKKILKING